MSTSLDEQIQQLKSTISEMESQRAVLGDETVAAALIPLNQKLAALEAQVELPEPTLPNRQRKLVTLLFMDVVGSTEMTRHLDPEDTMEIMDDALQRLAVPVGSHGGHVTRFMGDGFKAVFGDPLARESDPEQAIRSGLEIIGISQEIAQELDSEWGMEGFQVRIGINTGLVVLGGFTEAEDTIMGLPVNLAARLESAAPPGGLLISHNTYRHVRGVFDIEPLEQIKAKGFAESVPVYLVKAARQRAFRMRTLGVEGIETRMVGRKEELKHLQETFNTAVRKLKGNLVIISGEAGVGKSRLMYEFQNWLDLIPEEVILFLGRSRQEAMRAPYSLLRNLFTFRFQILDGDTVEQVRQKIEIGFGEVFGRNEDGSMRAHILGQLLGFDINPNPNLIGVLNDPEQLRNRGLKYLQEYFQELPHEDPVVVILEDIHWGDESSLESIIWLSETIDEISLLLLCTTRPILFERRKEWSRIKNILKLKPLSKNDSYHLLEEILKLAKEIPDEIHELLISKAEGNPFYMEEMIKMLIEDGVIIPGEEKWQVEASKLDRVEIPSTLVGVLQARLESLPKQEKTVLQQASVVGRLFWDRVVAQIQAEDSTNRSTENVSVVLTTLLRRELIFHKDDSSFANALEYIFKHDVLREVTYESVLKRLRKQYHGIVADWLIDNSGDRIGEHSDLIAEHLLLAGRTDLASEYFNQAGKSALSSYANEEAESFYRQALELSPRDHIHTDILSGLGESLSNQGDSQGAIRSWQKAIEINRALDDTNHLGDVYARLSKLLWHIDQVKAWHTCQEGLMFLEGAADSPGYARLLAEAGRVALFRTEIDQIMPLSQKALEMAQRLDDNEVIVDAKITIAIHVDDISERISILEEAIGLAKANHLLRAEARAHINLSNYLVEVDLNSTIEHLNEGAEIAKLIGDRGMMMFACDMLAIYYPELGELDSLEDKLRHFIPQSTDPNTAEFEFWLEVNRQLMTKRGEWIPALEATRKKVETFRVSNRIQEISNSNGQLVWIIMEMNRFKMQDDLSEAANALQENQEYGFYRRYEPPDMVILHARLGQFEQAHEWLAKALHEDNYHENDLHLLDLISHAEFELAYAEGRWSEAIEKSARTSKIYQESSQRWNWAREMINLGDALIGRNKSGDLERARETYQQSFDMFTEMGAPGYVEVLEKRLLEIGD